MTDPMTPPQPPGDGFVLQRTDQDRVLLDLLGELTLPDALAVLSSLDVDVEAVLATLDVDVDDLLDELDTLTRMDR